MLTGAALIPLEQATRPPKILVDSGYTSQKIPWRLLRCTGGPLGSSAHLSEVKFCNLD